jgi:hypothetical protein
LFVNFLSKRDERGQEELDKEEKGRLISQHHDSPAARHPGIKRTLSLLVRKGLRWKGVRKDVEEYVRGCQLCQKNKPKVGPVGLELHPFEVPKSSWEVMAWDLICPLPKSRTYNAIVTMVDIRTKAIKLEPADITITARGAAVVMKNRVFREEGLPAKVISDRGPQFMGRFMKELYDMLGIEGNPSTAYHPQTDRQMERTNHKVEKYLRMFVNNRQDDWADWLPIVEFAYNNAVHEATGYTPFYLNRGRHPRTLPEDPPTGENTSAEEFVKKMQEVSAQAEENLKRAKAAMKSRWEKSRPFRETFVPGDQVLVTAEHLPSTRPSRKLDQKWRGPFTVLKKVGEVAYQLELPQHWKGHRTFNEGRIKRFETAKFQVQDQLPPRPEPELVNEQEVEYEVQEILAERGPKTKKEFLVRWEGYRPEDDTWEPETNLSHAKGALKAFRARGRATRGGEYHVTASVTKEIKKGKARHEANERGEEKIKDQPNQTKPNPIELYQTRPSRPEQSRTREAESSQGQLTQDDIREQDSGSAPVKPDDRAALTGRLCRHVMALIRWQCGVDGAVDDCMVRALEVWLRRRGISIYTDLV